MGESFFINKILTDIGMETYDIGSFFDGTIMGLKKWFLMALFAVVAFIWIATFIIYYDYSSKHRKYDGKINKTIKDAEGRYNLETIDNYEDTRKKLEIERKEVRICRDIKEHDPDFSIEKFKNNVCTNFLNMQKYWSEGNLDEIRDLETDELYEQHKKILEDFSRNNQKNIREDISIEGCFINDYEINIKKENIIVDCLVKMKDYIVEGNALNNKQEKQKMFLYRITYVRSSGIRTNSEFEPGTIVKCPNCGAEVQVSVSEYCPFCKSLITNQKYGWVITNIEKTLIRENQIIN